MAASNQKIVSAKKESVNGSKKPYLRLNQDSLFTATQNLKPSTVILWLYIIKNQDGWNFELSSKHACKMCGISIQTYNRCIDELKEKGYLVKVNNKTNRWICYEMPERYKGKLQIDDFMENFF